MAKDIEHAERQATKARGHAVQCVDKNIREEWLVVARMWDQLTYQATQVAKACDILNGDDAA